MDLIEAYGSDLDSGVEGASMAQGAAGAWVNPGGQSPPRPDASVLDLCSPSVIEIKSPVPTLYVDMTLASPPAVPRAPAGAVPPAWAAPPAFPSAGAAASPVASAASAPSPAPGPGTPAVAGSLWDQRQDGVEKQYRKKKTRLLLLQAMPAARFAFDTPYFLDVVRGSGRSAVGSLQCSRPNCTGRLIASRILTVAELDGTHLVAPADAGPEAKQLATVTLASGYKMVEVAGPQLLTFCSEACYKQLRPAKPIAEYDAIQVVL